MKTKIFFILHILLSNLTYAYSKTTQDLIGTWTGKYSENDGKETITCDYTIVLEKFANNYLYGYIKKENFSNGKRSDRQSLKAYYANTEGNDSFIFDSFTFDQVTKNKSSGTIGFIVSIQDGKRVMKGRFFPNNKTDKPNFIMVDLYNTVENHNNIQIQTGNNLSNSKPARLSTRPPITLDASELDDFYEGFAILRKGENFALLRKSGDLEMTKGGSFLMPYGKYKFNTKQGFIIDKEKCGFSNGMCAVRDPDSEMYGFIDLTGKLIVPCTLTDVTKYMSDGYAWAKQKDAQGREEQVYIDKKGNKFRLKNQFLFDHNMLEAYYVSAPDRYYDFYGKNGVYLFRTKRHFQNSFSV